MGFTSEVALGFDVGFQGGEALCGQLFIAPYKDALDLCLIPDLPIPLPHDLPLRTGTPLLLAPSPEETQNLEIPLPSREKPFLL